MGVIYAAIAGGLLLFVVAAIWAGRRGHLFLEDFGAVILSPIVFLIVGGMRDLALAAFI